MAELLEDVVLDASAGVHRPRNLDWKRAAALLYGDWGTSKAYVIGLAKEWIFTEPFDTRPIDFAPDGEWTSQLSSERTEEAITFMSLLLKLDEHEDRTGG